MVAGGASNLRLLQILVYNPQLSRRGCSLETDHLCNVLAFGGARWKLRSKGPVPLRDVAAARQRFCSGERMKLGICKSIRIEEA